MKKFQAFTMLVIVTVCSIAFSACTDDDPAPPAQTVAQQIPSDNPYLISQEDAIANLKEFGAAFYESDSRSGDLPEIAEVIPWRISAPESRSASEDSIINDVLLYFVNFDKDEGFSVVSGDIRIPHSLLCMTTKGRITRADLAATGMVDIYGNVISFTLPEYPTDGPTFFTDPKYPGEVFINPNIGDFYVEEEDDTLVGNYESEIIETEGDATTSELEDIKSFEPGYFVAQMCINYARKIIIDGPYHFQWNDGRNVGAIGPIGGGGTMPVTRWTEDTTPWTLKSKVNPMLTNYYWWHQSEPFNNLYPERRAYILVGKKRKAPAGCFPLAIAKIMAYFRFPDSITFNGFAIDWDSVNYVSNATSSRKNKATLLYSISENCSCWYFYQGTFTFPNRAINFLKTNLFQDVRSVSYSTDEAIQMINQGYPTIVYGIPGVRIWYAHAWNIDGYKIQERKKTITYYNGSNVVSKKTYTEEQKMVHCDFGWSGNCNGYYCGSIFDIQSGSTEFDDPSLPNTHDPDKFGNYLHIIKYSLPR